IPQGPGWRRNCHHEDWAHCSLRSTRSTSRWLMYKNCGARRWSIEHKKWNRLQGLQYPSEKYASPHRWDCAPNPEHRGMWRWQLTWVGYLNASATSSEMSTPPPCCGCHRMNFLRSTNQPPVWQNPSPTCWVIIQVRSWNFLRIVRSSRFPVPHLSWYCANRAHWICTLERGRSTRPMPPRLRKPQ